MFTSYILNIFNGGWPQTRGPTFILLFMLFVNDILENINSDLNGIFTIKGLKLFLILYADDQALFALSPESPTINDERCLYLLQYWELTINTLKTKAMIFERGRHTHYQFYVDNAPKETVNSFKYLGMTLYKNGNWVRTLFKVYCKSCIIFSV